MKALKRIARPCGVAGGVWGLLAPVLVLLPVTGRTATPPVNGGQVKTEMVSMVEAGVAGDALPVLSVIAVMGLLGLLAILVIRRHPHLEVAFIWVSALATLVISLISTVTMVSVGIILLPAAILLILAAIGMRRKEAASLQEAT